MLCFYCYFYVFLFFFNVYFYFYCFMFFQCFLYFIFTSLRDGNRPHRIVGLYIKIIYVHIEWAVHTVNDVSHCSLLLPLFSSIAVAPRQEPLCGRHGLNDVVLTPSRPLVTANDVGHWDQKHPKVLIVGKKKREEFDSHV